MAVRRGGHHTSSHHRAADTSSCEQRRKKRDIHPPQLCPADRSLASACSPLKLADLNECLCQDTTQYEKHGRYHKDLRSDLDSFGFLLKETKQPRACSRHRCVFFFSLLAHGQSLGASGTVVLPFSQLLILCYLKEFLFLKRCDSVMPKGVDNVHAKRRLQSHV